MDTVGLETALVFPTRACPPNSAGFLFEALHQFDPGSTCFLREIDSVRNADDTTRQVLAALLPSFWERSHLAFTLAVRLTQWRTLIGLRSLSSGAILA